MGNGVTGKVTYVAGNPGSWVSFAEMWGTFTICSISRYTGGNSNRVLVGSNGNWLHGHYGNHAGVSHFNGWIFDWNQDITSRLGESNHDWVYMCASNSLSYVNGVHMGGGGGAPGLVNINKPGAQCCGEYSDFGIAELILWDRQLSEAEMIAVQAYQAALLAAP